MKKIILVTLFLLSRGIFGVTVEKNNISIQYEKCPKYTTPKFDKPYCLKISNLSSKPIVVDPSLIANPMITYQEITKALQERLTFLVIKSLLLSGGAGILATVMLRFLALISGLNPWKTKMSLAPAMSLSMSTPDTLRWKPLNISSSIIGSIFMVYVLHKLTTKMEDVPGEGTVDEAKIAKEVLHSPITIQPGESVEKLFWIKNKDDQVSINFDAIKVIE